MKNIRPITDLRKTNEISEICHQYNQPIYITKNGYNDLVIMSNEYYEQINPILPFPIKTQTKEELKQAIPTCEEVCNFSLIKVGCATNHVNVANCSENANDIIQIIKDKEKNNLDILVFPELCVSGYTCGDLFFSSTLLNAVIDSVFTIVEATKGNPTLIFLGAPLLYEDKLYNCAICICDGKILGIVPKSFLPGYGEFYENRQFVEFKGDNTIIKLKNQLYPFGTKLIFVNKYNSALKVACEICEDVWAIKTPSTNHCLAGANIIVNLSASNEYINKSEYRLMLLKATSARLICGYVYASAGNGESTQDIVYSSHNIICENGKLLKESTIFQNEYIETDIDIDIIRAERRKNSSFTNTNTNGYELIYFANRHSFTNLSRKIEKNPFLEGNPDYKKILEIQAMGLVKRLQHIRCNKVVLGLSGGLDSTLALLVCIRAFEILKIDSMNIHTITMPCFGTSDRTYQNALKLTNLLHTTLHNINISKSVTQHLQDIGHDNTKLDIAFENAQARERTQVLFDYANQINAIVIGTGDLSELALGWCTFNGDHMSNYGVNSSLPKTMVKYVVNHYADDHLDIKEILKDILDTPVSPELLPTKKGEIAQITEDVVGPYELHDFFLYHFVIYNFTAKKIFYLACESFKDSYDEEVIRKWLEKFISRFFASQFKRSTLPDGIKVTKVSLSPRGDYRMPSDASSADFLKF